MNHIHFRRRRHECCLFAGGDEYVLIGTGVGGYERTDAFSVALWYKSSHGGFDAFVSKGEAFGVGKNGRGWGFNLLGGRLHTRIDHIEVTNGITVETSSTGFDDDAWRHAVLTYDGSSAASGVRIYANAVSQSLNTISSTLTGTILNAEPLEIGSQDGGGFFNGYIDEVALYNKELTASEVAALYNGGSVVDYMTLASAGNLDGYWRMAEGSVFPVIPDEVGSNDGTMQNMQQFGPTRSRVLRP